MDANVEQKMKDLRVTAVVIRDHSWIEYNDKRINNSKMIFSFTHCFYLYKRSSNVIWEIIVAYL